MSNTKLIRYVAFLRAINVGGNRMIKMDLLKQIFTSLEFQNVKTYIASGNALFETSEVNEKLLTQTIEAELLKQAGFEVKVMIRTMEEIKAILENNPFKQTQGGETTYISFLSQALNPEQKNILESLNSATYSFQANNRELYVLRKKIIPKDPFSNNMLEKTFKIAATTRNINTVRKIAML